MQRFVLLCVLALVCLLALGSADAAHRCTKGDCSDVVGEGLVKDSLAHSRHFTEAEHATLEEQQRVNRIKMGLHNHEM
jgi:hypothetical protein